MPDIDFSKSYLYMLRHLTGSFETLIDQMLKQRTGIGLAPRTLLAAIRHHQPSTQRQIATFLHLTPGSISRQVEMAQKKGWLTIHDHEQDKRKQLLEVSPAGIALLEQGDRCLRELGATVFPDEANRIALIEHLATVQKRVDAVSRK